MLKELMTNKYDLILTFVSNTDAINTIIEFIESDNYLYNLEGFLKNI